MHGRPDTANWSVIKWISKTHFTTDHKNSSRRFSFDFFFVISLYVAAAAPSPNLTLTRNNSAFNSNVECQVFKS